MTESTSTPPDALSFEEAVRLFKEWGFQVESGPRPEEITLIIEGPGYRTYSVHPTSELAQMATVVLRVRQSNGTRFCRRGKNVRLSRDQQIISTPIGTISVKLN